MQKGRFIQETKKRNNGCGSEKATCKGRFEPKFGGIRGSNGY